VVATYGSARSWPHCSSVCCRRTNNTAPKCSTSSAR
jgi:hypothetical protein